MRRSRMRSFLMSDRMSRAYVGLIEVHIRNSRCDLWRIEAACLKSLRRFADERCLPRKTVCFLDVTTMSGAADRRKIRGESVCVRCKICLRHDTTSGSRLLASFKRWPALKLVQDRLPLFFRLASASRFQLPSNDLPKAAEK